MTTYDPDIGTKKPPLLRVIFILNALKIVLTFGFFLAFKFFGLSVHGLEGNSAAMLMLYTMVGYMATFAAIVVSILKRNIVTMRIAIVVDFLISIPPKAPIGFAIAVISMGLSFSRPVRAYFAYRS